jgi:hypothetical protein
MQTLINPKQLEMLMTLLEEIKKTHFLLLKFVIENYLAINLTQLHLVTTFVPLFYCFLLICDHIVSTKSFHHKIGHKFITNYVKKI